MKYFLRLLFVITIFYGPLVQAQEANQPSSDNKELKILSYNLRFGELASLKELGEFIKEQKPDIVALQEVDSRTMREMAEHQNDKDFISELGYYTQMFTAYGKTIDYKGGYYGIGLLSKFPIAKVERIYLPKTDEGQEQRAVLIAEIEYEENNCFTFASTHLGLSTEERQVQIKEINELLSSRSRPVILGGDFNAVPESDEIEKGMKKWQLLSSLEPTFSSTKPNRTIDYIFGFPKDNWKIIESKVYDQIQLSDHFPIGVKVYMEVQAD